VLLIGADGSGNERFLCKQSISINSIIMVSYKELGLVNTRELFAKAIKGGYAIPAFNFNNMEQGIFAANVLTAESIRMIMMLQNKTDSLEGIILEETLTNSKKYPFNDSVKTIALGNENLRNNKDYTVIVETEAADGFVGDIVITDKMLNGFKIAYTGSASSVKVKCYVQGGK